MNCQKSVVMIVITYIFVFMIGVYSGENKDSANTISIQGTYVIANNAVALKSISIDNASCKYYASDDGLSSVAGNYQMIDENVIVFLDGMLEHNAAILSEDGLLLVNSNDASGTYFSKLNDQVGMHSILIE